MNADQYSRFVNDAILKLMRAVDEAALEHFALTKHLLRGVSAGWACTECEATFVGELKVLDA